MRIALIAGVLLVALAGVAEAQAVTSYTFKVCTRGAACTTPITTYTIPAAEVQSGQPKVPTPPGTVSNPRYVRWDDPNNPTLDMVWDSGASSGPLFALPFSTTLVYDATIAAVNAVATGPESPRSNPFNRPGSPPAALTGLRVTGS